MSWWAHCSFCCQMGNRCTWQQKLRKTVQTNFKWELFGKRKKNPLLEIRKSWQNSFLFQLCNTCTSLWNSKKKVSIKFVFYYFAQMHFDVFYLDSSRNQKVWVYIVIQITKQMFLYTKLIGTSLNIWELPISLFWSNKNKFIWFLFLFLFTDEMFPQNFWMV